jgi:Spy/CpxP family protein refolding chaperone
LEVDMRKRFIMITAAAVLAFSGVAALDAQRGPGRPGGGGNGPAAVGPQGPDSNSDRGGGPAGPPRRAGRAGGGFMPGINLTDEQRTKVEAIVRSLRDQAAPVVDQLTLARKSLNREAFADKRDNAKITSLTNSVAGLEKQLLDVRTKASSAIADVLTPEQREVARASGVGFDGGFGSGPAGRSGRPGPGGPGNRGPGNRVS